MIITGLYSFTGITTAALIQSFGDPKPHGGYGLSPLWHWSVFSGTSISSSPRKS